MSDTLSETKACDLLARLFRARGYSIVRNVLFREYGVEFHVDGWDEKARVGFEFLSSEDEDHIDLSLEEYQTLGDAQRRGELTLFIIDEVEPLSAAELMAEAHEFLDEAAAVVRRPRAGTAAARKGRPSGRPGGAKAAAGRKKPAPKKPASKKSAGKAAAKKPAGGRGGRAVKAAVRKPTAKTTPRKRGQAARSRG
jgi:hypothetical protein